MQLILSEFCANFLKTFFFVSILLRLVFDVFSDFLDVPEYFWHHDQYQSFWNRVHRYLDVEERIQILNVRFGYIQEILKVISNERVQGESKH